ncbi:cobyric acid synthase CobQ [Thermohalobacter berrensis]|uniref:Cobyric acid synthase n=1 Tax=Thermohalobacter berrensis TaxID=99594 RepID=A0A419SZE9_9FIRM|nr:cobyric acid synthase CobQ [Thermohalobacter berrensis]
MAKNIMIQGTASSAGKSIITAALCRILKREGYKVAPFKSQNMALNSFVTKDGKEMGRAQVVQAEAAMVDPMVEMNPILLKPTSDVGSQVILNGEVYKNMSAEEYHKAKPRFKNRVKEAYDKLNSQFDVIIIEGAGSPAEINLRENDLVNMGLAKLVDSPVILVGDIDRGGVFASIYGTIELLEPEERERIKGFIINKFRGDVEILKPGIKMLEEKVNKQCLGVIPFMDINIDDEDSVTDRFRNKISGDITIAVIKLPYISNFTDFTPLEIESGVKVKYVSSKEQLKNADLIIIPGSKNTIMDMKFIYDSGIDKEIYKKHRDGVPIIGICGGYQILGKEIVDPYSVESPINRINGLSLLNTKTVMAKEKRTKQVKGKFKIIPRVCSNMKEEVITGYEIHMGETEIFEGNKSLIELENGRLDGAINSKGNVFGTYLHGIFENDSFRNSIINTLRAKKGIEIKESNLSYRELKEKEYEKLARIVKENIDINKIKKIMGL